MTTTNFAALTRRLLFACAVWWLSTNTAGAWGNFGHRVTGDIAAALLNDTARRQVQQLLGNESLADAAVFMDAQRDALHQRWPDSPRWHYRNRAVCGSHDDECSDGQCVTRQAERFRRLLADRRASHQERALALRLLVHMLGDLHQPLHTADNDDRGGNDVYVRLYAGAERRRLHEVFDTAIIVQAAGGRSDRQYAALLLDRYRAQLASWQQSDIDNWMQEAHRLGASQVYAPLPGFACHATNSRTITLPPDYLQRARRYLPEQLAKAGARIAQVLNDTLR